MDKQHLLHNLHVRDQKIKLLEKSNEALEKETYFLRENISQQMYVIRQTVFEIREIARPSGVNPNYIESNINSRLKWNLNSFSKPN